MKKLILTIVLMALIATPALAVPSLGWWEEGDARTTHQEWDFTNVVQDGGAYYDWKASPTSMDNITGIAQAYIHGQYDGSTGFTSLPGENYIDVLLEIGNYPDPLAYKEIEVALWGSGTLSLGDVDADGVGGFGPYAVDISWSQNATFNIIISPNPSKEDIWFRIYGFDTVAPYLADIHVDTICIPAPGAVLLGGIGVALVGWLRGRRTL